MYFESSLQFFLVVSNLNLNILFRHLCKNAIRASCNQHNNSCSFCPKPPYTNINTIQDLKPYHTLVRISSSKFHHSLLPVLKPNHHIIHVVLVRAEPILLEHIENLARGPFLLCLSRSMVALAREYDC